MHEGAAGFATSFAQTHRGADGQPIPSRWADRAEIDALCHVVGEAGRGVVAVNGGDNLSLPDVYALQDAVGAPFTFTAVLTTPVKSHEKAMEIHRARNTNGAVWPQVTCRPLSFSMTMIEPFTLNTNPVFAELMPQSLAERSAAYADPAWRQRVLDYWSGGTFFKPRWETYEVMESATRPDLIGRRLTDIAAESGADPFEYLLDFAIAEPATTLRVRAVLANDDPDGITMLLQEPGVTLGLSDAGAHVGQLCDAPQATDLLGNWVRDRQVISLERAVRMLSGQQADLFGFADRGYLRVGAFADIVVFDPATVAPGPLRRIRDFPANGERLTADQPEGMRHLLVNGSVVRRDGVLDTGVVATKPGRVLAPAPR
jgi:N-acyl-D-amino-acid deacylase